MKTVNKIKITHLKRAVKHYKKKLEDTPSYWAKETLEDAVALIEAADQTLQRMLKRKSK